MFSTLNLSSWVGAVVAIFAPVGYYAEAVEKLPDVLPIAQAAPVLDGRLDNLEWKDALSLGKLSGSLPRTEAWMQMSKTHLYIAIRCAEPTPEKMRNVTMGDEIKGPVWTDDSIEILIDLENRGKSIYRLVANSEGTVFDSQIVDLQQVVNGWTSSATTKARVDKEAWEIEVAIPMDTMGHRLVHGEVFTLNIGRNRFASGTLEIDSYAGAHFVQPKAFRRVLVGGPIEGKGFSMVSEKRGPFVEKSGGGSWEFSVLSGEVPPSVFRFGNGGTSKGANFEKRYITIPIAPGLEEAMRECQIEQGGKELFASSYMVQSRLKAIRVTPTKQPLFESLIEEMPNGLSQRGIINWAHELFHPAMKGLPLRTGMAYAHERTPFENYAKSRATLIANLNMFRQNPAWLKLAKQHGIGWMIYLQGKPLPEVPTFTNPGAKGVLWTLDPRMVKSFMEETREAIELAREDGNIKWFFAGDEVWERMHVALVAALDHQDSYPELKAADQEIREKYGFGKYGLPESSSDTNPFRWIATYRWEIDQMMKIARDVRTMMKEEIPEVGFVSWDCMTGHRPYAVGKWREVFDVVTAQIYPSQGNSRDHAGFSAKFYTDLTGVEVWPVAHVSNFPASFTAEETEEILSATFRGGATGLHLWSGDYRNEHVRKAGNTVVDRFGAPERWNVVNSVTERLPLRVKQPEPEAAIFYSNTSYQGTGMPKSFGVNNQLEWLYAVLGPKLGGAFRFIDDLSVPAKPDSLRKYKAVYIPYMPIADDSEYEALETYVQAGGTVVVCDPLAFRHRSDGTERTSGTLLAPLVSTEAKRGELIIVEGAKGNAKGQGLSPMGERYELKASGGRALARYKSGEVAIMEVPKGKGRVVFFGGSPLAAGLAAKAPWVAFFGSLQKSFGIKGEHDVWRFRFPPTPQPEPVRPAGLCLTGNYFEWSLSEPNPMLDARVGGSYVVRNAKTPSAEPAGKPVRFGPLSKGRLTDRISGAAAPTSAKGDEFVLTCQSDEPWTVTFEFDAAVSARVARLFFTGSLPEGTCEVSIDGKSWSPAGQWEKHTAEGNGEVAVQQISLKEEGQVSFVRLNFAPTGESRCALVEVDLWGREG